MQRWIATATACWTLMSATAWAQYPSSVTGAGGAHSRSSSGMFGSSRTVGGGGVQAGARTFSSGAQGEGTLQLEDLDGHVEGLIALAGRATLVGRRFGVGGLLDRLVGR